MTISWVRWCSEPRSQSHEHGQNFSTKNTPSAKMLLALCLKILYQPLEPLRCANIWKPPTSLHYACRTSTSIHESMQDINYACPTLKSVSESQATLLTRSACTSISIHEVSSHTDYVSRTSISRYEHLRDALWPTNPLLWHYLGKRDMFSYPETLTTLAGVFQARWVLVGRHFAYAKVLSRTIRERKLRW